MLSFIPTIKLSTKLYRSIGDSNEVRDGVPRILNKGFQTYQEPGVNTKNTHHVTISTAGATNAVGGSSWWVMSLVCSVRQLLYKPGLLNEQPRVTKTIGFTVVPRGNFVTFEHQCYTHLLWILNQRELYLAKLQWLESSPIVTRCPVVTISFIHSASICINPSSSAFIGSHYSASASRCYTPPVSTINTIVMNKH